MGRAIVTLDNQSNITTKLRTYKATPGLWELIMLGKPTNYTTEDFNQYQDLVEDTQVIFNPLIQNKKDTPKSTSKYRHFKKLEKRL